MNFSTGVIWRCLHQPRAKMCANLLLGLAGVSGSVKELRIRYECRPYHLGWALYAFAGQRPGR